MKFIYLSIYLSTIPDIGLGVRVFANRPVDLGSIPGRVIPKIQKMVLDASLLNTQHYKVRIKGKVEQSREGVAPSPWCSSYRKGNLRVTLDYGRQLYFHLYIYIIIIQNILIRIYTYLYLHTHTYIYICIYIIILFLYLYYLYIYIYIYILFKFIISYICYLYECIHKTFDMNLLYLSGYTYIY